MTARVTTRVVALLAVTGAVALAIVPGGVQAATPAKTVVIGDFFYTPKTATVTVGQSVRFVNRGRIDHTVADVDAKGRILGKAIRPKLLARGQAQTVRFTRAGTVRYLCTLHPTRMSGRIVVRPA